MYVPPGAEVARLSRHRLPTPQLLPCARPDAPQVITIICNLVMLLYFGGEIHEMRAVHGGGGGFGSDKGGEASPISADMQSLQLGSVSSGPTFRVGDSLAAPGANPFAQPV